MNQKNWIVVLVILVVILVGAVTYFVIGKKSEPIAQQSTPTPKDEIATWTTYTNDKFGYSIAVPMGAEVNSAIDNIHIGGANSAANIGISAYLKKNDPKGSDRFERPELYQYVSMTIGGNKVYRYTGYGTAGAFFVTTLFYGPTYNYEVMFSDEHGTANVDLASQIVSTFKFTK